jgi:hypothetical protein
VVNVEHYAAIVLEAARFRRAYESAVQFVGACDRGEPVGAAARRLAELLASLTGDAA